MKSHTWLTGVVLASVVFLGAGCLNPDRDRPRVPPVNVPVEDRGPEDQPQEDVEDAEEDEKIVWIPYTNEDMGFSLRYRSGMTLNEQDTFVGISFWGPTQREGTELFDGIGFTVESLAIPKRLTFAEAAESDFFTMGLETSDALHAVSYEHADGFEGSLIGINESPITYTYLQGPTQDSMFRISTISADPGNLGFDRVIETMLNSFKSISN